MGRATRREEAARRAGNPEEADAWRRERDRLDDARVRREAEREAREVDANNRPDYVNARVAEERARREQERAREDADRKAGRERSKADGESLYADLKAKVFSMQGRPESAKGVKEEARRRQDRLDRAEEEKRLIDQGFGKDEAQRMAGRSMQVSQAGRMLEEMTGRRSYVVADSLATVGGGGGVTGRDAEVDVLKKMERILQSIERNTGREMDLSAE